MSSWLALGGLVFLVVFRRYVVTRLVKGKAALWIYVLVTLPGVMTHEMAHFLTAAILGLRTGNIEVLPRLSESGTVEFGSVQVEKADPLRLFIVGMAPLLLGPPLMAWLWMTPAIPMGLKTYLLVSLAIHLLPSKKDMVYWPISLLILGLVGLVLVMGKIVQ